VGRRSQQAAWILALAGAFAQPSAQALGLGDIEIDSVLFRPLQARIPLLGLNGSEPDLRVSLASHETYLRLGIERPPQLSRLRFRVIEPGDGTAYIDVSGSLPQRDPMLQLLLRIEWPGGQLLREFSVLLDPPEWRASAPPAPADNGPVARASAAPVAANERLVAAGETLRDIARQYTAADRDLNQVMLALLRANPQAFRDGDINQLLRGARLSVPAAEQIAAISPADAARQISAQYRRASVSARADSGAVRTPREAVQAGLPKAAETPTSAQVSAIASQQLREEVVELRQRVAQREQQLRRAESTLAGYDERVAELRDALAQIEAVQPESAIAAAPLATPALVTTASAPVAMAVAYPVPTPPSVTPAVTSLSQPQPSAARWLELALRWSAIAGGAVLLLLALWLVLRRRRRASIRSTAAPLAKSSLSQSADTQLRDTLLGIEVEDGDSAEREELTPDKAASLLGISPAEPLREVEPAAVADAESAVQSMPGNIGDETVRLDADEDFGPMCGDETLNPLPEMDELDMVLMSDATAELSALRIDPDALLRDAGVAQAGDAATAERLLDEIDVYLAYCLPDQALRLVSSGAARWPDDPAFAIKRIAALILDGNMRALSQALRESRDQIPSRDWESLRQRAQMAGLDETPFIRYLPDPAVEGGVAAEKSSARHATSEAEQFLLDPLEDEAADASRSARKAPQQLRYGGRSS
jgi:FimV-like protein